MRYKKALLPLLALPVALGGCGLLGMGSAGTQAVSATPTPGQTWMVVASGSATPSPKPSFTGTRPPALPPVSFLPVDPQCTKDNRMVREGQALIPLEVVPGAGSLTVTWPRQYMSDYRVTAVKQPLRGGNQPDYTWQSVPPATSCTVTATITGLKKGTPYIVWLDAPNTGYLRDGTRHPYSGRSGVVFPR
ncbi:hypothetical protein ACFQFC_21800 [Amorphoplanes digitatis]|uniref:Fibronectin type-III domain-containing protein n=1 Tax=Actinoplanes digitatis TaxID=1868 RepID=A0A7W7MUJ7_9ACTN|nr:hypothetical protein [Actinoplanes digitatis]MBB4766852.1 hypothetical protein [Actinoplanes digitatis]GID97708.1 hypothetical protein Adi01nite_71200 [Actinoplanes digitatis]